MMGFKRHMTDLLVAGVFLFSLICFLGAFWRMKGREQMVETEKDDAEPEVDYMFELDKDIIFTDKDDYRIAVGYQNAIFQNGLRATMPEDGSSKVSKEDINEMTRNEESKVIDTLQLQAINQNYTNATGHSSSDDEDSIDQNAVVERFKEEMNGKVRQLLCDANNPLTNIISIKTHRTGSSTLGNILYRLGDVRNLSFILPAATSFQHYWPLRFHMSHARIDLLNKAKPNMAVNLGRFDRNRMLPMMRNDTVVMTMLREPVDHFESVYEYADISRLLGLWNTTRDPFGTFLEAPRNNVIQFVQNSKSFAMELNLLKNGMAFDLGLDPQSFSDEDEITNFINKLEKQIDFVLIAEYFDESLVLLKRILCWDIEDIIYVNQKVRRPKYKNNITDKQKEIIRNWNKADLVLYQHFNRTLWDKIEQQDDSFYDEVKEFKIKVAQVKEVCFKKKSVLKSFEMDIQLKKNVPKELKSVCNKLKLREKEYVKLLKEKQKEDIVKVNLEIIEKIFFKDVNNSKIFYEFENRTDLNLTLGRN